MNGISLRSRSQTRGGALAVAGALALSLAACGGSDGPTTAASSAGSSAAPTGGPGGGAGMDFTAIQACLKAAGIDVPTPSGTMGARPTDLPSGMPSGAPPTDAQGGGRGGGPGGAGGMGTILQSDAAKAALSACGLTVPTGGPAVAPTPSSTAATGNG